MPNQIKLQLGQLLVRNKTITPEQLETALTKQKETGEPLGVTLLQLGFIDEEAIFMTLVAEQLEMEFISLRNRVISPEVIAMVPSRFTLFYQIFPIDHSQGILTIATSKRLDTTSLDALGMVVRDKIKLVLANEQEIQEALRQYYGVGAETIDQMMGTVEDRETSNVSAENIIETIDSEASIGKFVNQILSQAYHDRATDIHIEPYENELKIRYRIDGVLRDAQVPGNIKHFKDSINSRIKIISRLNIAEKRLPQDGRFKIKIQQTDLDLRVSFMPTQYGESVVIRILSSAQLYDLKQLGLLERDQKQLQMLLEKPNGILFVTGPTGSGKTTTLYACLSQLNSAEKKIITLEDPIEYQIPSITQIQVQPNIGLSFAAGLRSVLRHDPDIIMVGEVRDFETAEIAIQVALTGHLVFSTLHTNDAVSGITRLLDIGVEPFLIASSVHCFIAQRLLRLICPKCRKERALTQEEQKTFSHLIGIENNPLIWAGEGCKFCKYTGYYGREGIYEFLLITNEIREMIMQRASASQIQEKSIQLGMKTLLQSGWDKVRLGLTTPNELLRVTQEIME